jgi:hypothetical protein
MLKIKEMTAAEACKRMDTLAREYLCLDRFDPRRVQMRKELHELAALVEPPKDEEAFQRMGQGCERRL